MNSQRTGKKPVSVYAGAVVSQTELLRNLAEARGWEVVKEYTGEGVKLDALAEDAVQGLFEAVIIPDLAEIGSSVKDIISILEKLGQADIDLVSVNEPTIDTTKTGRAGLVQILKAVDAFQDKTRRRKINEGIKNARARGRALGPPVRLTEDLYEEAIELRREGLSFRKIGKKLRLNESTIRKRIKQDVASGLLDREPQRGEIKKLKVRLWLLVERNSKFVRGKKKVLEDIEDYVLPYYEMVKPDKDGCEYELKITYENEDDLENTIHDLYGEMERTADRRNCFIDADIMALDGSDRSW